MKVALDISALDSSFKAHAGRGIGRYVSNLYREFSKLKSDRIELSYLEYSDFRGPSWLEGLIDRLPRGKQNFRQHLCYPFTLGGVQKRYGFDLLHFPANMDAPSWGFRPYAVTVLDLIFYIFSDLYKKGVNPLRYDLQRAIEKRAIMNADLIFAISENTKKDLIRLFGIQEESIVVTPLAVEDVFFEDAAPFTRAELKSKFSVPEHGDLILYVGGIDPRKNYTALLQSLAGVRERARSSNTVLPILMIAGRISSDREYPKLIKLAQDLGVSDALFELGFLTDEELIRIYHTATLFFFPSLYEGFGFPPLEAMATGLPVLSSNSSSMPEVLGSAGILVDPYDIDAQVEAMWAILCDGALRNKLIGLGKEQAGKFSWSRTAEATYRGYDSCNIIL